MSERWQRDVAVDGEYTGPGDNPPGYSGDPYATNDVGYWCGEGDDTHWVLVASCSDGRTADRVCRLPQLEREVEWLRKLCDVSLQGLSSLTGVLGNGFAQEEARDCVRRWLAAVRLDLAEFEPQGGAE